MAYVIGRAHKLVKQNIKLLYNTTDTSSEYSTPSYSYYKFNENTDITSKRSLTTETHSRTIFSIEDKLSDIIQKKYASNPYSKDMLISNISIDNDAQSFKTPRIN